MELAFSSDTSLVSSSDNVLEMWMDLGLAVSLELE
jgi:hypothetical protein